MSQILTQYWQALWVPVGRARQRWRQRAYERAMRACGCSDASKPKQRDEQASGQERLEQIALYARAGYFNMGYTVDAFSAPADLPPH
ncbi:hypothetical protein [Caballeronia sp. SL2Y3]|uniref:hypothetical protein n=1 Tax=Caballeronia sp. SL2Y3 TaxID=2878151 RepID=UPI001FD2F3C4|nr:hypothetical protein [Caballeronia sp. SL2Y3]